MTITPEQFMTQAEPDEELETDALAGRSAFVSGEPVYGFNSRPADRWSWPELDTIAETLQRIESKLDTGQEADALREAYDDLDAKHTELYLLLGEIEDIVKPSTSKLANSVREAINRWRAPEVPAEPVPVSNAVEMGAPPPAHDATVEEWRLYANTLGYIEPQVDVMNRSQIRTLLGIEQPGAES